MARTSRRPRWPRGANGWARTLRPSSTWVRPSGATKTVSADRITDGGGSNPATGYSLVDAADIDAATAIAKGCPVTRGGGTVEVGEAFEVST